MACLGHTLPLREMCFCRPSMHQTHTHARTYAHTPVCVCLKEASKSGGKKVCVKLPGKCLEIQHFQYKSLHSLHIALYTGPRFTGTRLRITTFSRARKTATRTDVHNKTCLECPVGRKTARCDQNVSNVHR